MTREELADYLGMEENYLLKHWTQVTNNYNKRGIDLYKLGRGISARYGIKVPWESNVVWNIEDFGKQNGKF